MLRQRHRTYAPDSVGADDSSVVRRLIHKPAWLHCPCGPLHNSRPLPLTGIGSGWMFILAGDTSMDLESRANLAFGLSAFAISPVFEYRRRHHACPLAHLIISDRIGTRRVPGSGHYITSYSPLLQCSPHRHNSWTKDLSGQYFLSFWP